MTKEKEPSTNAVLTDVYEFIGTFGESHEAIHTSVELTPVFSSC